MGVSPGRGTLGGMPGDPDPDNLERFVEAQAPVRGRVEAELRAGEKRSHWMWFVFPQIAGLGQSPTSRHFAIASLAEARAYVAHPVLGPRLLGDAEILAGLPGSPTADHIFGSIDAAKLRSSMTLFELADPSAGAFARVLDRYFDGVRDELTLRLAPPG